MIKKIAYCVFLLLLTYLLIDSYCTRSDIKNIKDELSNLSSTYFNYKNNSGNKDDNNISKQLLSLEKRISYIEKKLIISDNLSNNKSSAQKNNALTSWKYENASEIIEKAVENGEFTTNDIKNINQILSVLSDSDRISIENKIIDVVRNNGIEMPKPDPSEVKDIAIDEKDIPVNAIKVSP